MVAVTGVPAMVPNVTVNDNTININGNKLMFYHRKTRRYVT